MAGTPSRPFFQWNIQPKNVFRLLRCQSAKPSALVGRTMMRGGLTCLRANAHHTVCDEPRSVSPSKDSVARYVVVILSTAIGGVLLVASPSAATPGGLNAQGCHNDRKGGTRYHCHNGLATRTGVGMRPLSMNGAEGASTYFPNCSAARATGAAPVRAGSPGYSRKLDRDGDGIGCE